MQLSKGNLRNKIWEYNIHNYICLTLEKIRWFLYYCRIWQIHCHEWKDSTNNVLWKITQKYLTVVWCFSLRVRINQTCLLLSLPLYFHKWRAFDSCWLLRIRIWSQESFCLSHHLFYINGLYGVKNVALNEKHIEKNSFMCAK